MAISVSASFDFSDADDGWSDEASDDEQAVDNQTLESEWWDKLFARAEAETAESAGGDGDASIEWLLSYRSSGRFFTPWLSRDPRRRTLLIGCGNSDFPVELHADGWCPHMVASDFSSVVVDYMRRRYTEQWAAYRDRLAPFELPQGAGEGGAGGGKKRAVRRAAAVVAAAAAAAADDDDDTPRAPRDMPIEWEVQDARRLTYGDASAHCVLDKSLVDCMWYAEPALREPALRALVAEVARVLVRDGSGSALFMTQRAPGAVGPVLCAADGGGGGGGGWWSSVEYLELRAGCDNVGNLGKEAPVVLASEADAHFESEDQVETLFLYICKRRAAGDSGAGETVAPVPVPDQQLLAGGGGGGGGAARKKVKSKSAAPKANAAGSKRKRRQ